MISLSQYQIEKDYYALLVQLSDSDRELRFGYRIDITGIKKHIDKILNSNGYCLVYGTYDSMEGLACVAELWFDAPFHTFKCKQCEIAIATNANCRGKGYASSLFHQACIFAKNIGATTINIFVKSHNKWMRKIAAKEGMQVKSNYAGEVDYQKICEEAVIDYEYGVSWVMQLRQTWIDFNNMIASKFTKK